MKLKKKRKNGYIYKIIAIGCLFVFSIILLSSILDVGIKLRETALFGSFGMYVEIAFYIVVFAVIYLAIVYPIMKIVKSPSLTIVTTLEPLNPKAISVYKKISKNMVENNDLSEEEVLLLTSYKTNEELLFNLQVVFEQSIKKQLNRIIISNAKTVMISTAICQSARFDMITVFGVNLRMIKELVEKCGYRPSMTNLSKLTVNVFSTALIAEGLENLSLEDVLPKSTMSAISEIPMLGKTIESISQGAANALMTVRIGCVCRRYLFNDGKVITKEEIRRQAYKETLKIIPLVVADTVTFFPKKVVKFFSKKDNLEEV
jgi:hypothetical protein